MVTRNAVLIWLGILMLSGIFLMGQESWAPCLDGDGDGYGASGSGEGACPLEGWDCADDDETINPGVPEVGGNYID